MKKLSLIIGMMISFIPAIFAQDYPDSLRASKDAMMSDEYNYAMQITDRLCDAGMYGRGYSNKGDKLAAEYIAGEFQSLGLTPMGRTGKDYYQKFFVAVNTFPKKMILQLSGNQFIPGVDYIIEPSSPGIMGTFKAVVVNREQLGNSMTRVDKMRQARGQVLIIDNTPIQGENPVKKKQVDQLVEKFKTDVQVQAVAVIIYDTNRKYSWRTSGEQSAVRPIFYFWSETDLSSVTEVKLDVTAEYQPKYETQNVLGLVEGSVVTDSFVVVACHYDHLGTMGDAAFPGANNGASGVAMMLNLAKHFQLIEPKISIIFIAFSGNELGFAGGKAFASEFDVKRIKLFLNLDLMGYGYEGIKVINGDGCPEYYNSLEKLSREYKLLPMREELVLDENGKPIPVELGFGKVRQPNTPQEYRKKYTPKIEAKRNVPNSEHFMFSEKGVPSMFIYSVGGPLNYHNMDDTPQMLPYTRFTDMRNLFIRLLETVKITAPKTNVPAPAATTTAKQSEVKK